MSKQERYAMQGQLVELRAELATLENRAEILLKAMRGEMFVYTSPLDLDTANIVVAAGDLDAVVKQAKEIKERIAKVEDDLGL